MTLNLPYRFPKETVFGAAQSLDDTITGIASFQAQYTMTSKNIEFDESGNLTNIPPRLGSLPALLPQNTPWADPLTTVSTTKGGILQAVSAAGASSDSYLMTLPTAYSAGTVALIYANTDDADDTPNSALLNFDDVAANREILNTLAGAPEISWENTDGTGVISSDFRDTPPATKTAHWAVVTWDTSSIRLFSALDSIEKTGSPVPADVIDLRGSSGAAAFLELLVFDTKLAGTDMDDLVTVLNAITGETGTA